MGQLSSREIKAVAVERWLGSIDHLSNGTKAKIKGIMSEVFNTRSAMAGSTMVGFHTFRDTYSRLLKANGEDVKGVQELMRHANISDDEHYTKLLTSAKREAQSRVVDVLLDRSKCLEVKSDPLSV